MSHLRNTLAEIIGDKDQPIVVYSALWPLERAYKTAAGDLCRLLSELLLELAGERNLLFPTFTSGFTGGVCDLDREPSQTGALSEHFRLLPDVRRTVCAFFSFAVHGKDSAELAALRPREAWGEGSLYEWLYQQNARIITLGVHPTHCSFTHYAEWLMRSKIHYRHAKAFSGTIRHEGNTFPLEETLLVRQESPEPINDFTWLLEAYHKHGMMHIAAEGVSFSGIDARTKIDLVTAIVDQDPLALLKNRKDFT
jgi:aminoglycoside N3'-acetyltransferase